MSYYRGPYNRRPSRNRKPPKPDITIEPARGATYGPTEEAPFAAYEHGTYGRGSVLEGQHRRVWLDSGTLAELKARYPGAQVIEGSTFAPPAVDHLSDQGDL